MSVLIDPYMFELTDEQEIKNNISFFAKIIELSNISDRERKLNIAIYKGVVEKIQVRSIQPFPIRISDITDKELKRIILQINQSFSKVLLESIENVDIDVCEGDQMFLVDDNKVIDEKYYELFCTLLIPCYSSNNIDERILTGNKKTGKHIGDTCVLKCGCEVRKYQKKCIFAEINDFISYKDKAVEKLREKFLDGIKIEDSIQASMGAHHNYVQADGKKFDKLDDLSNKNKIVLRLLKKLGLFKVIFGRFLSQGVRSTGTMSVQKIEEKETQDILVVKFSAETKMLIETSLYFPKGIGRLLSQYFQSEQLTYKSVNELLERIG